VRLARLKPGPAVLAFFGVLGAPIAWTLQHVAGISLTLADCGTTLPGSGGPAGAHAPVALNALTLVVTAVAASVAVLAGLSAFLAWRATREAGADAGPPEGRTHFLAVVGMTVTPLFLFIILMSGLTTIFMPNCHQA
jgi:heme/copper-type cytochrome/quinol oxidase subunit 2